MGLVHRRGPVLAVAPEKGVTLPGRHRPTQERTRKVGIEGAEAHVLIVDRVQTIVRSDDQILGTEIVVYESRIEPSRQMPACTISQHAGLVVRQYVPFRECAQPFRHGANKTTGVHHGSHGSGRQRPQSMKTPEHVAGLVQPLRVFLVWR